MKFKGKGARDKMTLAANCRTGILCLNENRIFQCADCKMQQVWPGGVPRKRMCAFINLKFYFEVMRLKSGLSCPPGLVSWEASTVFICFVFTCLQWEGLHSVHVTQSPESTLSRSFTASSAFEKMKLHLCILFYFIFLMTFVPSLDAFRASFYHLILRFSNNISQHRVISCWIFFLTAIWALQQNGLFLEPGGHSCLRIYSYFSNTSSSFHLYCVQESPSVWLFYILDQYSFSNIYIKPYIKYICLSVSLVFKQISCFKICLRILYINVNTFFKIKSTFSPPAPQLLLYPHTSFVFHLCVLLQTSLSTYSVANIYLGVGQTEDQGNKFLKKTDSPAPQQSQIANNSSAKSKTS